MSEELKPIDKARKRYDDVVLKAIRVSGKDLSYAEEDAFNEGYKASSRDAFEAVKGVVEALEGEIGKYSELSDTQLKLGIFVTKNKGERIIKARAALKAYKIHIGE